MSHIYHYVTQFTQKTKAEIFEEIGSCYELEAGQSTAAESSELKEDLTSVAKLLLMISKKL